MIRSLNAKRPQASRTPRFASEEKEEKEEKEDELPDAPVPVTRTHITLTWEVIWNLHILCKIMYKLCLPVYSTLLILTVYEIQNWILICDFVFPSTETRFFSFQAKIKRYCSTFHQGRG